MDRRYKVKVWKDRMVAYPTKWCWEVFEHANTDRVIGCGTTFGETAARETAALVVQRRMAQTAAVFSVLS